MDAKVTHVFLDAVVLQVTVSTVHLEGVIADARAELGCHFFGHSRVDGLVGIILIY